MAKGDVLDWTQMEEGDSDKELTFNNAVQRATKASHDTVSIAITGADTTLTDAQFLGAREIVLSAGSPAPSDLHTLKVPSWKKAFLVDNGAGVRVQLETTDSPPASGPQVAEGERIGCYCDGTNIDRDFGHDRRDIEVFVSGQPAAGAIVAAVAGVERGFIIRASMPGSNGYANTAANAQADFDVKKNGSSVGTVRFAASSQVATFIAASDIQIDPGDPTASPPVAPDRLEIVAPNPQDANLADIFFGIVARLI